jgi:Mce-associated membrane protein
VTPTWYDLLGVEPDASPDEIRAAWKAAIADLDPTDRRFKALNEAAEVLLDPARRSEYDASLVPEDDVRTDAAAETEAQLEEPGATHPDGDSRTPAGPNVPAWLLAALALLVAVALGCAGYLVTQPSDDAIADATSDAQGAAERSVATILAYDYRHLDDDQKAAESLMTPSYQKKYDQLFSVIKQNAPGLQAVVTVQVIASGIVRSGDDRVQVLVFLNRPTTNKQSTEPTIYRDQVVMTMEKSDGDWLVDNMDTNQLAS